jgi:hypothetical protein
MVEMAREKIKRQEARLDTGNYSSATYPHVNFILQKALSSVRMAVANTAPEEKRD